MIFIIGLDRNKATLFPTTLEQSIDKDNEVRIIDPSIWAQMFCIRIKQFQVEKVTRWTRSPVDFTEKINILLDITFSIDYLYSR